MLNVFIVLILVVFRKFDQTCIKFFASKIFDFCVNFGLIEGVFSNENQLFYFEEAPVQQMYPDWTF